MDERDDLDRWIDRGLQSYSAEPPVDLTGRVLAEARRTPLLVPRPGYVRRAGIGIAAAGLLVFLLMHHGVVTPVTTTQVVVRTQQPARAADRQAADADALRAYSTRRAAHPSRRSASAAQAVSPPMTAEEQWLLALATDRPGQALVLIAMNEQDSQPLHSEPVRLAPIEIEALAVEPISNSDSKGKTK